ncbi:hypothetical protein [Nitrosomonas sp. Nm33]|uniref:hypothetical protein n=1 Tax=Nitrosomonas sp. Nm33 TaxID=133724 RepID=UPI00089AE41D|nr:hypothetical protein [Nitrosomonas sp. Nm33]SDY17826.1 hypothetical protein SAMN05421755_101042 [Nitrosomonas sp. Nm33]
MGRELERLKNRRKASDRLSLLLKQREYVLVVHYSCESFYDRADGRTPRVTSIAVRNLASGQTQSFSIHKVAEQRHILLADIAGKYDDLEKAMLDEFFDFVRIHQNFTWMHWNMRDINYGFQAIEHRYTVLDGVPTRVEESRKSDLARELIAIYGVGYIGHPRLESLVEKNKITNRDFLVGAQEAAAFENKEFVKLHQSTLRKVDILANIAERAANDSLSTNATWRERYGFHPSVIVEVIKEHWVYSLLGLFALIFSLARGWTLFF